MANNQPPLTDLEREAREWADKKLLGKEWVRFSEIAYLAGAEKRQKKLDALRERMRGPVTGMVSDILDILDAKD